MSSRFRLQARRRQSPMRLQPCATEQLVFWAFWWLPHFLFNYIYLEQKANFIMVFKVSSSRVLYGAGLSYVRGTERKSSTLLVRYRNPNRDIFFGKTLEPGGCLLVAPGPDKKKSGADWLWLEWFATAVSKKENHRQRLRGRWPGSAWIGTLARNNDGEFFPQRLP